MEDNVYRGPQNGLLCEYLKMKLYYQSKTDTKPIFKIDLLFLHFWDKHRANEHITSFFRVNATINKMRES